MHNFAAHCIATATRILFYIVCFYYLFIVPPISSRIKTTFQHLSFKSVSANRCESSLISRLEECSQVFPWTAPVPGTRTRKLSAVSGGCWAPTRRCLLLSLSTRDSVRCHRGSGHDWADLLKWNFAIMNISQELSCAVWFFWVKLSAGLACDWIRSWVSSIS